MGDCCIQCLPGLPGLGDQHLLLLTQGNGLRAQLFGIAGAVVRVVVLGLGQEPDAFGSQGPGRDETLAQGGQRKPAFLRAREQRRRSLYLELKGLKLRTSDTKSLLSLGATGDQGGLVGDFLLQDGGQLNQVVGQQPKPGVASLGLDRGGLARSLGLATQRSEMTANLTGQVIDPDEVGLHRLHLAQGALLALAVLQDASGLLDEATALLRSRAQDGVELPLTDDDVHLVADTGVGEQLLDIQQAAGCPVEGVLRTAVAKHGPRDGDLGVVDRQRAVAVVDGQGDLGPPQRSTARGAGKDDVLHLAAAQALGALLPHDPGKGVNDIGLAGAVRPDDAGDAGLEPQRRHRGEGLETPQGQGFDVHKRWAPLARRRSLTVPTRSLKDGEAWRPRPRSVDRLPCRFDLCGQFATQATRAIIVAQPVVIVLQVLDHGLEVTHPRPEPSALQK